ncbi:MAG: RAMP superfamily CRISPR-associated protein [Bacillota bacterium]
MPEGASWNPYRWVPVRDEPVHRTAPAPHLRMSGWAGTLDCRLTALTCLVVGQERFIQKKTPAGSQPVIPGTSLKGAIRSLCEVVGNGCAIIGTSDSAHQTCRNAGHLCITCRMFGFVKQGQVLAGHVSFGDAALVSSPVPPQNWPWQGNIVCGNPKPEHEAFYPADYRARKFYHHQPTRTSLPSGAPAGVGTARMIRRVQAAPAQTVFAFQVSFQNLDDQQLGLLVYALTLEPGLAHKVGGCKPLGAGSSLITVERLVRFRPEWRYTGQQSQEELTGASLAMAVDRLTTSWRQDQSETMQALRCLLRFDPEDRRSFAYPRREWFDANAHVPLRSWRQFGGERE